MYHQFSRGEIAGHVSHFLKVQISPLLPQNTAKRHFVSATPQFRTTLYSPACGRRPRDLGPHFDIASALTGPILGDKFTTTDLRNCVIRHGLLLAPSPMPYICMYCLCI